MLATRLFFELFLPITQKKQQSELSLLSSFIAALMILTLLSTFYDVTIRKYKKEPKKLLNAFSLYTNFNNLMKINHSESAMKCIDGMKVLSAFWIIVGHRKLFSFKMRSNHYEKWDGFARQVVEGYNFGVDTFITCSAILVTQSLLRAFET